MKYCSTCVLEYPDTSGFCKSCGGQLASAPAHAAAGRAPCPTCGAAVQGGWRFCKQCGENLDELTLVRARPSAHVTTGGAGLVATAAPTSVPDFAAEPPAFTSEPAPRGSPADAPHAAKGRARRWLVVAAVLLCVALSAAGAATAGWYMLGVSVAIQTDPGGSRVLIDGEEVGRTNEFGSLLTPRLRTGEHTLSVTHDGHDAWRQDFKIALTDFSKSLNVKLNPTKYRLTINTSPAGSEVLIDGSPAGNTSEDSGTLETAPLAPGAHTVLVRADGYRDWKQSVELKAGAKLDVTLSAAPAPAEDSSSAEGEVRTALNGWAQSIQNRDIDAHMRYYADTLDYYYARSAVQSSRVRDDRTKAFQKFSWLSIQLGGVNVQMDSTGERATVVFDKTFDFRGDSGAYFSGSVQNQLTLTRLGGAWLITGEKELKVYDVKSSSAQ
jgi:PEGA domain/Double zinc ribbon